MLILTRKTGQGFLIGDDVEIVITEISGDKVRIGIEAPKSVKVLRTELRETMESNQQAAGVPGSGALRALAAGLKGHAPKAAPPKDEEKPPAAPDGEAEGKA